mgnify:CR=1 FL=1
MDQQRSLQETRPLIAQTSVFTDTYVIVRLSEAERRAVSAYARAAEIGGMSNIRGNGDRQAALVEDQLSGMACNYGFAKYLGRKDLFAITRYVQNKHRTVGDDGEDLIGLRLDVKGGMWRYRNIPIAEHHLLVRPAERHAGHVYVMALYAEPDVILVGWLRDDELPDEPEPEGMFKGAHAVKAASLHPLPPLRWVL